MNVNKNIVYRKHIVVIAIVVVQFFWSFLSVTAQSFQAVYGNNAINYVAAVHVLRTEILKKNPTQIFDGGGYHCTR